MDNITDLTSPIEKRMREVLIKRNIKFKEQVSVDIKGRDIPKYFIDFVVYGEFCKIAVECDGQKYHSGLEQRGKDAIRDLWLITNRIDDVLRFTGSEIKNNVDACLNKICREILKYDSLKRKQLNLGVIDIKKIKEKPLDYYEAKEVIEIIKREVQLIIANQKSKKLESDIYLKEVVKGLKKILQSCHININDQLVYFVYPFLEKLILNKQIDMFFVAYDMTYVVILFGRSNRYLDVPKEIISEEKIIKVFVAIGTMNKQLQDIKTQAVRQWILIDSYNGKIIDSDIIDIEYEIKDSKESNMKNTVNNPKVKEVTKRTRSLFQQKYNDDRRDQEKEINKPSLETVRIKMKDTIIEESYPEEKANDAENTGKDWTLEEDATLTEEFNGGFPISQIARLHKRKIDHIESRLKKLGLISFNKLPSNIEKPWKPEEDEALSKDFDAGMSFWELSNKYGRHKGAIQSQLLNLGKRIF